MRKLIVGLVLVMSLLFTENALADNDSIFDGVELNISLSVDTYIQSQLAISGQVVILWNTLGDSAVVIIYNGVRFDVVSWYSLYVRFGITANRPSDLFGFDISLRHDLSLLNNVISFSFQTDMIFHSEGYTYYGFYRLSVDCGPLDLGVDAEQIDSSVYFGPHLGFDLGPIHTEIQYFNRLSGDPSYIVRLVFGLALGRGGSNPTGDTELDDL